MKTENSWNTHTAVDTATGDQYHAGASRRKHARTRLKLPVQFEVSGGPVISAYTTDLSLNGMQVRCDRNPLMELVDAEISDSSITVLVVMRLKVGNRLSSQVLHCRLSYLNPLRSGKLSLGLQFDALLPDQQLALLSVMEQAQATGRSQDNCLAAGF